MVGMGFVLLAALALTAPAPVRQTVLLPAGHVRTHFAFTVRAPAFRAVRLEAPHGADVRVQAWDAHRIAGVGISTRPFVGTCKRQAKIDRCESQIEACPAPQGRWTAFVVKRSDPPARVRVTFLFANHSG